MLLPVVGIGAEVAAFRPRRSPTSYPQLIAVVIAAESILLRDTQEKRSCLLEATDESRLEVRGLHGPFRKKVNSREVLTEDDGRSVGVEPAASRFQEPQIWSFESIEAVHQEATRRHEFEGEGLVFIDLERVVIGIACLTDATMHGAGHRDFLRPSLWLRFLKEVRLVADEDLPRT